jgi:glutathione S-transferase
MRQTLRHERAGSHSSRYPASSSTSLASMIPASANVHLDDGAVRACSGTRQLQRREPTGGYARDVQTQQLTLFVDGYFTSIWDASCFVSLTEKQLEFTASRALLRDGQALPPALRRETAIARIPALLHGDFWLTESLAIVEYLEDAFPPPTWPRTLPDDPRARARARQIMAWMRFDQRALRDERPWQFSVYPGAQQPPLSPAAERNASELVDLVVRLSDAGELDDWNISHADLAFGLWRLARSDYPLPPVAQRVLDRNVERPSIRAYLEHPRPPNPPPYARSWIS